MRLDLFLKTSRLIARRSLAQQFCDAGLIKINNLAAKSSRDVKAGDEIEIKKSSRLTKFKVLVVPDKKQISRTDAANLYEIVSEERLISDN
jgi:ribosomal 50S subunit-recycling heat shock protein